MLFGIARFRPHRIDEVPEAVDASAQLRRFCRGRDQRRKDGDPPARAPPARSERGRPQAEGRFHGRRKYPTGASDGRATRNEFEEPTTWPSASQTPTSRRDCDGPLRGLLTTLSRETFSVAEPLASLGGRLVIAASGFPVRYPGPSTPPLVATRSVDIRDSLLRSPELCRGNLGHHISPEPIPSTAAGRTATG